MLDHTRTPRQSSYKACLTVLADIQARPNLDSRLMNEVRCLLIEVEKVCCRSIEESPSSVLDPRLSLSTPNSASSLLAYHNRDESVASRKSDCKAEVTGYSNSHLHQVLMARRDEALGYKQSRKTRQNLKSWDRFIDLNLRSRHNSKIRRPHVRHPFPVQSNYLLSGVRLSFKSRNP